MKTNYIILFYFITIGLLLASCSDNQKQPKANYDENGTESQFDGTSIFNDTTKTQIANLPISFDSTDVLLHISGFINTEELNRNFKSRASSSISKNSDRYDETYFYTNEYKNSSSDYISGWFSNIYFDDLISNKQQLLTQQPLFISDAYYLRKLDENKKKHYVIYSVYDKDSNKDNLIDKEDLLSKYISKLDGSDFKKVTPEGHDFIKGVFEEKSNRYYFITIEDSNKDGFFNKEDKYNYFYIDFSGETYSINTYNPLNNPI